MKKSKKTKKFLKTNEKGNTTFQNLWDAAKHSSKNEVHSDTGWPRETVKKILSKQFNLIPKSWKGRKID